MCLLDSGRHFSCDDLRERPDNTTAGSAGSHGGITMKNHARIIQVLFGMTLLAALATAGYRIAAERNSNGIFVGGKDRLGSAGYSAQVGDQSISDDPFGGGAGALRAGYAFSNSFALSLEGHGFGTESGGEDWGMGAGFLVVTWWPDGSGFFLRVGGGSGGGEVLVRQTGSLLEFDHKFAGLFGLGYEWQLTNKFALGVAMDGIGFDLENESSLVEDFVGLGNFSIQFNWYL
jgi:hypothetical protein